MWQIPRCFNRFVIGRILAPYDDINRGFIFLSVSSSWLCIVFFYLYPVLTEVSFLYLWFAWSFSWRFDPLRHWVHVCFIINFFVHGLTRSKSVVIFRVPRYVWSFFLPSEHLTRAARTRCLRYPLAWNVCTSRRPAICRCYTVRFRQLCPQRLDAG